MSIVIQSIAKGGVAAFFFFSWIIQLLWNSIVVDQLALAPVKVTYWQAAGLWFLVSLLLAWVGIGLRPARALWRPSWRSRSEVGERIKRTVRSHVRDWLSDDDVDDDLGERIEARIKDGFGRWVGSDTEFEWDDLGDLIEEKIKRKVRDWADE